MKMISTASAERVRQIVHYEPSSGIFVWRGRESSEFRDGAQSARHACARWNSRFAGKVAGSSGGANSEYLRFRIDGEEYLAHRLAWLYMTGEWPEADIDHVNMDKSDNRFSNLRKASRSQNKANCRKPSTNTSGLKGAFWTPHAHRWCARIKKDGKITHLGYYDTAADAHSAYLHAATLLYGEFARAA